ncbi:MAG: hypothetical protein R2719_10410 [Micropruina sp.]
MAAAIGRRLAIFLLSLLGASIIVFAVCSALPGAVAEVMLGEGATEEQVLALTAGSGSTGPSPYATWSGSAACSPATSAPPTSAVRASWS